MFGRLQSDCIAELAVEEELAHASAAFQSAKRFEHQADLSSCAPSHRALLCSRTVAEALHNDVEHVVHDGQGLLAAQRHVGEAERVAGLVGGLHHRLSRPGLLVGALEVCANRATRVSVAAAASARGQRGRDGRRTAARNRAGLLDIETLREALVHDEHGHALLRRHAAGRRLQHRQQAEAGQLDALLRSHTLGHVLADRTPDLIDGLLRGIRGAADVVSQQAARASSERPSARASFSLREAQEQAVRWSIAHRWRLAVVGAISRVERVVVGVRQHVDGARAGPRHGQPPRVLGGRLGTFFRGLSDP